MLFLVLSMRSLRHMTIKIYSDQFEVISELAKEYKKSASSIIRAMISYAIDKLNDPNTSKEVLEYIDKEFGIKTKPLITTKKVLLF
jgi:Ribbon-helix-helix protein, copG family.